MSHQQIIDAIRKNVKGPSVLEHVASTVCSDLLHGPIYTDGRGEWVDCFDQGSIQFDYVRRPGHAHKLVRTRNL